MKSKLVLTALLAVLLIPALIFGAPVNWEMAERAGATQVLIMNAAEEAALAKTGEYDYGPREVAARRTLTDPDTGVTLAYILDLQPEGCIVISPDTEIEPVIFISHQGEFVLEDSPRNIPLRMVTWDMSLRLEALELDLVAPELRAENAELWKEYLRADGALFERNAKRQTYGPHLTNSTNWHQGDPYNMYCPLLAGHRTVVGCGALAMSQIIDYHRYPASVTFTSADSYTTSTHGIRVNAPDASDSFTYPAHSITAARLAFACGVALRMDYGLSVSLSSDTALAPAFKDKFNYSSANLISPNYTRLRSNMVHSRPAIPLIQKPGGLDGHFIVIDGYRISDGKYHTVWGWGGTNNGWYSLPTGMPDGYSIVHSMVVDIIPDAAPPPTPPPPPPTTQAPLQLYAGDFSGNGKADLAIFRPSTGLWAIRGVSSFYFGRSGDIPVPADYNGDGTSNAAIFRPSQGRWYVHKDVLSGDTGDSRFYFGRAGDIPIPVSFRDGHATAMIFRPSTGYWVIRAGPRFYYGRSGDIPVPGPWVSRSGTWGEPIAAIFRPSTGLWAIRGVTQFYFGRSGDIPVPGAYSASSTAPWRAAIFRPSTGLWAIRGVGNYYFGSSGDIPVPMDYAGGWGDNIAIFRPSTGLWAIRGVGNYYFGRSGDVPVTR